MVQKPSDSSKPFKRLISEYGSGEFYSELLKDGGVIAFKWDPRDDSLETSSDVSVIFPLIKDFNNIRTGKDFLKTLLRYDRIRFKESLQLAFQGTPVSADFRLLTDDGEEVWINITLMGYARDDKFMICGLTRNVTALRRRLTDAARLAYTDNLTGLFNRAKLKQKLALALAGALEYDLKFGFFVLNIDNLSGINENFGHDVADTLIRGVGDKLLEALRSTDVVARIASGRFGILLTDHKPEFIEETGRRLLSLIRDTVFETRSGVITATVSGGGCVIPDDGACVEGIMNASEESLALARSYGRDNFVRFKKGYEQAERRRKNILVAREVVSAVRENRVTAAFQAVVDAKTHEPVFYECLARLRDPQGEVSPGAAFIPVAENIGFVRMLDRNVCEIALEKLNAYPRLNLSVNVSGHTISDPGSSSYLLGLLRENSDVASRLIVEITETVAMEDMRDASHFIIALKEAGCRVALDDFGAGYTSFYNLKTFPFDMVKLDGVYIRDLCASPKNAVFIKALSELAYELNLDCVAEMVSSQETAEHLQQFKIHCYQGFLYHKPEVSPDFSAFKAPIPSLSGDRGKKAV